MWPAGEAQPLISTLNSDGRVKANAAIVPAGVNGGVSIYVTDNSHVILDINGYFVPATASSLTFYPLAPCRIADTRNATGPLGGPALTGGVARFFPVASSNCNVPASAKAYSLNMTGIPHGWLGYLTVWAAGQNRPVVSTLNSSGVVTANAAIVPAGSNGDVAVYATNDTDLVIDVNGYFAPPSSAGLSFHKLTACRVLDTRSEPGVPFDGTMGSM